MLQKLGEKKFTVKGLTISGVEWIDEQARAKNTLRPVIALHGWLDNAASFFPLAARLSGLHLLTLDSAGHGLSDWRSPDSAYNIWQDVAEVLLIADQMGWDRFTLMGHSRGAIISTITAGSFPERIEKIILIDALTGPISELTAPQQLAKAIKSDRRLAEKQRSRHQSVDDALHSRIHGLVPMSEEAARGFIERGLCHDSDGYYWSSDPRLQGASEVKFDQSQYREFIEAIECPSLMLVASQDLLKGKTDGFKALSGLNPKMRRLDMDGTHHLHMEPASVEQVAAVIHDFLKD
ncbi:MAG: alpha/beta fold hydrolase [bacterium]